MSTSLKEFESELMDLPAEERALLAEHLLASLDELDKSENERLWVKEAERRYREYKSGNAAARPIADAISDARSNIQ